jgi:thiamine pyrophosphate-dependent acetolactate synthase large subunit-like protein
MLPPLGNTFFEATIPSSVTKIISQFDPFLLSPEIRYDKVFEPFGCHVERAEHPSEIRPALYRCFNSGKTAVLDVEVDRNVCHPMLTRHAQRLKR